VGATVQQFDDFKAGVDNSGPKDADFDDGGDEVVINDSFGSNTFSLTYDNNGNLTDDGIFAFVYDAWNRLVKAKHKSAANAAVVKTLEYLGDNRLATQVFSNSGTEATLYDGGNRTDDRYYAHGRFAEARNGGNQTVQQVLWDASSGGNTVVWIENNGDVTIGNDTTPDTEASGENVETPADARYLVHADRAGHVSALTQYDSGGTNNGRIVHRYVRSGRTLATITQGNVGNGELANSIATTSVGTFGLSLLNAQWTELAVSIAIPIPALAPYASFSRLGGNRDGFDDAARCCDPMLDDPCCCTDLDRQVSGGFDIVGVLGAVEGKDPRMLNSPYCLCTVEYILWCDVSCICLSADCGQRTCSVTFEGKLENYRIYPRMDAGMFSCWENCANARHYEVDSPCR
jgi:hypothetical protein